MIVEFFSSFSLTEFSLLRYGNNVFRNVYRSGGLYERIYSTDISSFLCGQGFSLVVLVVRLEEWDESALAARGVTQRFS